MHENARGLSRREFIAGAAVSASGFAAGSNEKSRQAFVPLRPGAVSPRGWLRDWAAAAADGITGHLDEYSATFGEAWKGHGFQALGAQPDGTGWPLEQCSYWLDGAVRLAYGLGDQRLIAKVKARLDLVVNGVLKGGESFIYWRPKTVLNDRFNSWAHSHMGRALVAYYQASNDRRVLEALTKVYRNYPIPDLLPTFKGVGGAVNIDPALETYRMSGDAAILANVIAAGKARQYSETVSDWNAGRLQPGHNVVFYEHARVPALLTPWTGNRDGLDATLRALEWNDREFLLPVGISSGEEWQAGIGSTRNTESCNVAASIWTYLWLSRITGDGRYCDRIEKIFFNAAAAPIARDFKTMCYYQSPNRYSTSVPGEEPGAPVKRGSYRFTRIGHEVLCCVGNSNRFIPNYLMHMWMATPDGGLAATLYGPSRVEAKVASGVRVAIESRTAYPFEESIELVVEPDAEAEFPLHLRIPSWCGNPRIQVTGSTVEPAKSDAGFVRLARRWKKGDQVVLTFPMPIRVETGVETPYPQVPYFKRGRKISQIAEMHNPFGTVSYGPLLFALPIADETPNQEKLGQKYNYALDVRAGTLDQRTARLTRSPMPKLWNWPLEAPVRIEVPMKQFAWEPTELQPLPKDPVTEGEPAKVALVPYGCTKFRVSMFPVTPKVL